MYLKIFSLFTLFWVSTSSVWAQNDYEPWTFQECTQVGSRWQKCYILTPQFTGPNALPIPQSYKGEILDHNEIQVQFSNHNSSLDNTQDIRLRANIPLSKRVAVQAWGVVFEQFHTPAAIMDERFIVPWNYEERGTASGDLYLGTIIQFIKNRKRQFNMALSFNLKTASGNNLENIRFTDTPGYFMDVSAGKTYHGASSQQSWKIYANLGFMAWQTYSDNYKQDDAIWFGLGLDWRWQNWVINQELSGYRGYLQGDSPTRYQAQIKHEGEKYTYSIAYSRIFQDYTRHVFQVGFSYKFPSFF